MESTTFFSVLISCLGIVLSQNPAPGPQQPPMCLMECMSEWITCEYECRIEFPVTINFIDFQDCAMPCEEERMMCMAGSPDPACNNNTLNNVAHLPFQVDLTPTTTAGPTTTPVPTTAAPTPAPTTTPAPTPAPTPAAAVAASAPKAPVAGPAVGPYPKVIKSPQIKKVASNPQPVTISGPSQRGPNQQVKTARNIFSGLSTQNVYRPRPNNRNQNRVQRPMPASSAPSSSGKAAMPATVQQAKHNAPSQRFGHRFLKVHKLSYNLNNNGK